MKRFTVDNQTFILSNCGEFVALIEGEEQSGWFRLSSFNIRFIEAAKQAK